MGTNTSASGMADPFTSIAVDLNETAKADRRNAAKAAAKAPAPADDDAPTNREVLIQAAGDKIESIADNASFAAKTLTGDIRDCMLEMFKHRAEPWDKMSPHEQRDTAVAVENAAIALVEKAVAVVASQNRPEVQALMKSLADDGNKITVKLEVNDASAADIAGLHAGLRRNVLIVLADPSGLMGQRGEAVDPEEPTLDLGDGTDDDLAE